VDDHDAAVWHPGTGAPSPRPFGRLDRWVRPHHLGADAVEAAHEAFSQGGAVVLDDFLDPAVAGRVSRFLAHGPRYRRLHGLFPDRTVSEDEWSAAPPDQRAFRLSALDDIPPAMFQLDALWFAELRGLLADEAFAGYLGLVTGRGRLPRTEVGVHALHPGDFVAPHDDARRGREVAFVLFLTPGWESSFGGALHVLPRGRRVVVDARFNRFAAFDTSLPHAVEEVRGGPDALVRRTVIGWSGTAA
jgi:hypothetical protein